LYIECTYIQSSNKKQKVEKKKIVTSVYITGLPYDTTLEEMKEVFSKYGIISEDINTGKYICHFKL